MREYSNGLGPEPKRRIRISNKIDALEVKHKCILLVDDDIELNSDIINRLYKEHKENSLRVIGTEGVKLNPLIKEVKPYDFQEGYVDVVYGRVMMIPKQLVNLFWENESVLDSYKDKSIPPWNGFDIFLSQSLHLNMDLVIMLLNQNKVIIILINHLVKFMDKLD